MNDTKTDKPNEWEFLNSAATEIYRLKLNPAQHRDGEYPLLSIFKDGMRIDLTCSPDSVAHIKNGGGPIKGLVSFTITADDTTDSE